MVTAVSLLTLQYSVVAFQSLHFYLPQSSPLVCKIPDSLGIVFTHWWIRS